MKNVYIAVISLCWRSIAFMDGDTYMSVDVKNVIKIF